jgi:hypothetical protein
MHNSPAEQIDDWGVWAIELDFSIKAVNGVPRMIIGHDGPGSWTEPSWGFFLRDFLESIKSTRSFAYRPVFVYFGKKDNWGDKTSDWVAVLGDTLIDIFGENNIFGPKKLASLKPWPTSPELKGKIIPIAIEDRARKSDLIFLSEPGPMSRVDKLWESYVTPAKLAQVTAPGKILAMDQYQHDWTYNESSNAPSAPPNPLYVKANSPLLYLVRNTIGKRCSGPQFPCWDPTDPNCTFLVGQHGTFKFPYRTVSQAYNRAKNFPGWTILIKAGSYNETLVIDKPVTLEADGGTVTIGK